MGGKTVETKMSAGKGGALRWIALAIFIVFVAAGCYVVYAVFDAANMPENQISHASEMFAQRLGWSINLVKGLVILVSIPYFIAWSKLYKTGKEALWNLLTPKLDPFFFFRSRWGIVIVIYVAAYYIVLSYASKDAYAFKNCAETPDGIYATDNTGVDPHYGIPLKPCTDQEKRDLMHPDALRELSAAQVKQRGFFSVGGSPKMWFATGDDGSIHLFDHPGTDSDGNTLQPVTHQIAATWYRQQRHQVDQQQAAQAQKQHAADLATDEANAQQQYSSGAYAEAIASCKPVLAANASDESCSEIEHDASAKFSAQLADQAQSELQHGELVNASRDAEHALKLDPTNEAAKHLQVTAQKLEAMNKQ